MTTSERSLVGIRGWLAVYLAWYYWGFLILQADIWFIGRSFSDVLAVGQVGNDLRVLLALHIVEFCMVVVGIWMIHTRQPRTRRFFLVWIPIPLVLMLLDDRLEIAIRAATAGHTLGAALSRMVQQPQPYSYIIPFVLHSVSWLYWFRSERVKQTFAPMNISQVPAQAFISSVNTDVESAPHSELADMPQSSTVIRIFLVDAILLVLILGWHIGIRLGILGFPTPLRVLLAILWSGAMFGVLIYGFLPFRGRSRLKYQFDIGRLGLSIGIAIILRLFFGSIIPHEAYTGIGLAVLYFGLPRWEDKFSIARAGAVILFSIGVGLPWHGIVGEVPPTRASDNYTQDTLPSSQRTADTLPSLFLSSRNKKAQAASESTIKK